MFNKKILLALSMVTALRLESASSAHHTLSLDEPIVKKTGINAAHPCIVDATARLIRPQPVLWLLQG
jgi:hypothetical protein